MHKQGYNLSDISKRIEAYYGTFPSLQEYRQMKFKENCPSGYAFCEYMPET